MPTRAELPHYTDKNNCDTAGQIKDHLTTHGVSIVAEKTVRKDSKNILYIITAPQVPILTFRKEDIESTVLELNDLAESLFQNTNLKPDIDRAKAISPQGDLLFRSVTLAFAFPTRRIYTALFPNIRVARNQVPDLLRDDSFVTQVYYSNLFDRPA